MRESLIRRRRKDYIYDKLHRGVVWSCIGFSVVGSIALGIGILEYIFISRPKRMEEYRLQQLKLLEGEKVEEQSS